LFVTPLEPFAKCRCNVSNEWILLKNSGVALVLFYWFTPVIGAGVKMMMGERQVDQSVLFYEFSLEKHVPVDHMLRSIDRFVDLGPVRTRLASFYSTTGRPSIDPELLIRMLIIGYCYGIRSERRLCEEVHLNLAYRWFCRLGLAGEVPDHSTFSKNRHGRFRESDLLRHVFETVLRRCIEEGLVGGDGFATAA
jgi:transposase